MRKLATCRILLLALLLAVSHVALASHVAAHAGLDVGPCALCYSHAKSGSATLHTSYLCDDHSIGSTPVSPPRAYSIPCVDLLPYQTRAPPFII